MKVAILTYYGISNYGTQLQAYGLWKFLASRGHEVHFLDEPYGRSMFPYHKPTIRSFISRHPIRAWRNVLKAYFANKVTQFNVCLPKTQFFSSVDEMAKGLLGYDAVVVGSDLVWHPKWCSPRYTDIAFLGFAPLGCKRIAISPSFSATTWDAPDADKAGALLGQFDGIGVREKSGIRIVQEISGRQDANVFIDSALLQPASTYAKLAAEAKEVGPYVFNYMLSWTNGDAERKMLTMVKSELGIKRSEDMYCFKFDGLGVLAKILGAPRKILIGDWLRRIMDAKFVFTNSFHGTVFSILFHRPFVTVLIKGEMSGLNERAISLAKTLGLEDRLLFNDEPERLKSALRSNINWDDVDAKLMLERARVSEYLDAFGL